MPLPEEYVENIKSKIADLKNIGVKGGGSITAALFLKVCVCVYVRARTRVFVCVCVWEADPCRIEMHLAPPPALPSRPPPLSQEFVDKAKWAHLDIAGPVWDDAKGATGIQLLKSPLRSDFFCTVNILGEGEGGPLLLLGVNK